MATSGATSADASQQHEQSASQQPCHSFPAPPTHLPQQQHVPPNDDPIRNGSQPFQHSNASSSAESASRRTKKSPFSPTSSSPPLRNSLSSHASDMGRRLAQERSKNHQLMQHIQELRQELESTVSLLQQEKHDNSTPDRGFPSPPLSASTRGGTVNSSEKTDALNMNRVYQLEEALRLETQRREAAEKKAAHLLQQSKPTYRNVDSVKKTTTFEIESDSSIMKLLEQASTLLSEGESSQETNTNTTTPNSTRSHPPVNHDRNDGFALTEERMHEYHELVTAFHSEQQSHGDLDGEEFVSREDILWLFQELKLRFEDILRGYAMERSKREDDAPSDNEEWRECLEGLVDVVTNAMSSNPSSHQPSIYQQGDEPIDNLSPSNDTHILQNEVSSLNQRLASFAAHHKETCRSLYDDMEATKRDHQERLANKSQCIQNLESKISEQEEYIAQIQKEAQKDEQWIKEEKEKLSLSKEGTTVRIRYLEGMLRSLQMELKDSRTPQGTKNGGVNSCTLIHNDGAVERECGRLSSPVFMRDLTAAMQDVELIQSETTSTCKAVTNEAKDKDGEDLQSDTQSSCEGAENTKLRHQVASFGNSLAVSETQRANSLDNFQKEREKYVFQYKQLSDILKQLIDEGKCSHS